MKINKQIIVKKTTVMDTLSEDELQSLIEFEETLAFRALKKVLKANKEFYERTAIDNSTNAISEFQCSRDILIASGRAMEDRIILSIPKRAKEIRDSKNKS
jgi:hypothetical protein